MYPVAILMLLQRKGISSAWNEVTESLLHYLTDEKRAQAEGTVEEIRFERGDL